VDLLPEVLLNLFLFVGLWDISPHLRHWYFDLLSTVDAFYRSIFEPLFVGFSDYKSNVVTG